MDGLFKKTMSYLNSEGVVQDEFVGRIVEVAAIKLKILRKIAEGERRKKKFPFPLLLSVEKPTTKLPKMISVCGWMLKLDQSESSCRLSFAYIV